MGDGLVVGIALRELPLQTTGDLGHLEGMGQSGSVEIAIAEIEDLRLALQASEGSGMDDASVIDVALVPGVILLPLPTTSARQPNVSHGVTFQTAQRLAFQYSRPWDRAQFCQASEEANLYRRVPHR